MISRDFQPTFSERLEQLRESRLARYGWILVFGWLAIGAVAWVIADASRNSDFTWLLAWLLAAVLFPLIAYVVARLRFAQVGPQHWEIHQNGVRIGTASGAVELAWESVDHVSITKNLIILYLTPWDGLWLPTRLLDASEQQRIREWLALTSVSS